MKFIQYLTIVTLLLSLASCSNIVYQQAVPADQTSLKEFPTDIRGIYVDNEQDTLQIDDQNYKYGNLNGNPIFEGQLGENVVLKQFENYYFLNFKNEHSYWEMIAVKKTDRGLSLLCIDIENQDELKKINRHLKNGQAKSIKEEGKFIINPETNELLKLLSDTSICDESHLIKLPND